MANSVSSWLELSLHSTQLVTPSETCLIQGIWLPLCFLAGSSSNHSPDCWSTEVVPRFRSLAMPLDLLTYLALWLSNIIYINTLILMRPEFAFLYVFHFVHFTPESDITWIPLARHLQLLHPKQNFLYFPQNRLIGLCKRFSYFSAPFFNVSTQNSGIIPNHTLLSKPLICQPILETLRGTNTDCTHGSPSTSWV